MLNYVIFLMGKTTVYCGCVAICAGIWSHQIGFFSMLHTKLKGEPFPKVCMYMNREVKHFSAAGSHIISVKIRTN